MRGQQFVTERIARGGAGAGGVFPLRFGRQPVGMARGLRQPFGVGHGVRPADVDRGIIGALPRLRRTAAAGGLAERLEFTTADFVQRHGKVVGYGDLVRGRRVRRITAHGKFPGRQHREYGADAAIARAVPAKGFALLRQFGVALQCPSRLGGGFGFGGRSLGGFRLGGGFRGGFRGGDLLRCGRRFLRRRRFLLWRLLGGRRGGLFSLAGRFFRRLFLRGGALGRRRGGSRRFRCGGDGGGRCRRRGFSGRRPGFLRRLGHRGRGRRVLGNLGGSAGSRRGRRRRRGRGGWRRGGGRLRGAQLRHFGRRLLEALTAESHLIGEMDQHILAVQYLLVVAQAQQGLLLDDLAVGAVDQIAIGGGLFEAAPIIFIQCRPVRGEAIEAVLFPVGVTQEILQQR